ncbi:MAG TPA: B12-binding domain-containing radical SAM protein, partial [Thermodesulfobacteriota bacterium]|nr:B12-binding domain-containing radical SAM protein [Thermodesulfobacteriota bacterium]
CASQDFCLKKTKEIIDLIKLYTNSPLVLGGVGISIAPLSALQYCDVDFGIWGEGEHAFPLLIKAFAEGRDYEKIPGLLWKDKNSYRLNPASYLNLQEATFSRRDTVENLRYFREGGMVGFETKRGCDQACRYCADPLAKGIRVRVRSPEDVARELKGLAAKGISCFHTCDSEFNVPHDHALEVCQRIVRKKLGDKITWYTYASPSGFSTELAHWMKKAGCVGIDFGVDSGSELMLKNLGRNHTVENIREVATICHHYDFAFMFDLLLGGPGETRETVHETIDLMKEANPSRVGISLGIRIYAGTYFGKTLRKAINLSGGGFFGNMSAGMLRPLFYLSPALGKDVQEFVRGLIAGDDRFLFGGTENIDENYNYNENTKLIQAIKKGFRGAFWDILRRVEEGE